MKSFKFFSLLFPIIFMASCIRQENKMVTIKSQSADSIFTEIYIFTNWHTSYNDKIQFKGGETVQFEIDSFSVRYLWTCANDKRFSTQVFVTQGDEISFKPKFVEEQDEYADRCKNYYELIFEGKNSAHYNYVSLREKALPSEEIPEFEPGMDLWEYKEDLQNFRSKGREFLSGYKKDNSVSPEFVNWATAEIENLYVYTLYQVARYRCLQIPKDYFDDAEIIQNPLSMLAGEALKMKYIFAPADLNMERRYNIILDEVIPEFHTELLSEFITHYSQQGDRAYKNSFLKMMEKIEKTSTDSLLLAKVQEYKPFYMLSGTTLPDSILDNTFLRSYKSEEKITLRQVLEKYKNTAFYLDIWASWCGPCRYVTRNSAEVKSYLEEKGIAFVYISVDEDEKAWLKAAEEDGITENQYLLYNDNDHPFDHLLGNYLKINFIPRFVLFNKNHEMEILSAPRPIKCEFNPTEKVIESSPEKFISEKNSVKKNTAKKEIAINCEDTKNFAVKTIYHDNFGTFQSETEYIDAWGTNRACVKKWQTTYSPYNIPNHKVMYGTPDPNTGVYTIGTLKRAVMREHFRGGMIEDASGDPNGAVLCINIRQNYIGEIYRQQIDNLSHDDILYFEVSIANASYTNNTTPPQVEIRIEKTNGELLGNAHSELERNTFGWQKININVPPTKETSVVLRVISTGENWLDGNDLLMDDIIFKTCRP